MCLRGDVSWVGRGAREQIPSLVSLFSVVGLGQPIQQPEGKIHRVQRSESARAQRSALVSAPNGIVKGRDATRQQTNPLRLAGSEGELQRVRRRKLHRLVVVAAIIRQSQTERGSRCLRHRDTGRQLRVLLLPIVRRGQVAGE